MKDAFYFSHDSNARHDPKLVTFINEYGLLGYSYFFILIELLREQDQYRLPLHLLGALTKEWQTPNNVITKEIIDRIGWPTKSKVGENSAHYAWLLVQHADQDLEFQKKCLELMKQEQKEELEQEDIAYLEDRILVAENKQQLYGTQWYVDETTGEYNPEEIVEPDKLDERRAEMGMEPFAVYEKDMRKMYEEWQKNKNTPTAK